MRNSILFSCLLVATCVATACGAEEKKKPTGAEAEGAAAKWIEKLGEKGLTFQESVAKGGFVVTHGDSAVGRITKFEFSQDGWQLSLAFRGEHTAKTPVMTLQNNFWHAVLDRVPTPGLDLPGWDVRPQTPVSSFEKGVEILSYGEGKMKVRVRTSFFALYGRDPSVLVPADAPSPPGSYFQIRKDFPLDLTLEAPATFR